MNLRHGWATSARRQHVNKKRQRPSATVSSAGAQTPACQHKSWSPSPQSIICTPKTVTAAPLQPPSSLSNSGERRGSSQPASTSNAMNAAHAEDHAAVPRFVLVTRTDPGPTLPSTSWQPEPLGTSTVQGPEREDQLRPSAFIQQHHLAELYAYPPLPLFMAPASFW